MKRLIFALSAFMLASLAFAQVQTEDTLALSLEDAKKFALEHNRTLQNASLAVKQKYAARWQSIATMLPQASASLDYMNMCGYEMELMGLGVPMNPYGTFGVKASMAVSGTMVVGAVISNIAVKMADITAKKSEQTIINNVVTTYYSILTMESTLKLLEKNYENLKTLHKRAQKAVDVGAAEQTSADQIEVQVNSFETQINDTKVNKEVLTSMMRLYLGLGMDENIELTDGFDNLIKPDETQLILDREFNIENNYDYQLVVKQTELAKKQEVLAAMSFVPTLSAYYQYSAKTYFGKEAGFNNTPPNVVGVSLSIPLWTSGKNTYSIKEKRWAREAAENTQRETEDKLNISNYQLRYNLKSAYDKFKVQEKNIEVCQKVLDNTSKKFEYGYGSSTDVTTASQSLINAQTSYVSALLSTVEAYLNLKDLLNVE
ncbi:MAG: TolC family protein [Bacteroidales bacterium]|nr:TolC family protein [Bacteroidales bacterium]MDY6426725.1 TolC family protein [Bacteroidales bacterium]